MQSPKRALICGISGQDGAYLAQLLLEKGYSVYGTARDATASSFLRLKHLAIADRITISSMPLTDYRSVLAKLSEVKPHEIYNLSGQTSVGLSFEQPYEAIDSIAIGTLNLLEAIRFLGMDTSLYNAGSSESFGETAGLTANEATPFRPRSPYAVAKACAHNLVSNYRDAYGLRACTGILFNHESPLRPSRFVTQKIVRGAFEISQGRQRTLRLGALEIERDWGWAPDYVVAMWMMLQRCEPADFVIATGRSVSLKYFVDCAFSFFNLRAEDHLTHDPKLMRPSEIGRSAADPARARNELGWVAQVHVEEVIERMCHAAMADDTKAW